MAERIDPRLADMTPQALVALAVRLMTTIKDETRGKAATRAYISALRGDYGRARRLLVKAGFDGLRRRSDA